MKKGSRFVYLLAFLISQAFGPLLNYVLIRVGLNRWYLNDQSKGIK